MPDREKVIRGLATCGGDDPDCHNCPYYGEYGKGIGCETIMQRDALTLLKAQGQKKRESKAMLPCKCGCKRREHRFGGDDPKKFEMLKCSHCGFTAYGKNATDVIRNWNKAVRENADT